MTSRDSPPSPENRPDRTSPPKKSPRYVVGSIALGVFFGGLGGGVAFPTLPKLGLILGISPFVVSVILSMNRFTRLVMNAPAGQLLDRIGARRPMVAGFFIQALAPFGYILGLHTDSLPLVVSPTAVFIASRMLWGIGSAFVLVGAFSMVTHITTTANRGRWTGVMRGAQTLGFPAGLASGGVLTDLYGYDAAFFLAGCAGMLSGIVALFAVPNVDASVKARGGVRTAIRLATGDRRILTVGSVNFVVRFLYAGVLLSTIVLATAERGLTFGALSEAGVSGVVMAISVLFASTSTLVAGEYSDGVSNRALVTLPSLVVFGVGFIILSLFPTVSGTVIGVALIGLGVGGTNPPLLAYLGDISPEGDIGKMTGMYNVFGDLGSTLGPLVALPLAAVIGYDITYLGCVLLVVVIGILVGYGLLSVPSTV